MTPARMIWFSIGMAALGLAVLGVALPLLPTTPFLILAAFAFARCSERWHDWLITHPVFGPIIDNWRQHGAISRRAKTIGAVSMAAVFGLSLAMGVAPGILAIQAVVLFAAAAFVLSRPSPPD